MRSRYYLRLFRVSWNLAPKPRVDRQRSGYSRTGADRSASICRRRPIHRSAREAQVAAKAQVTQWALKVQAVRHRPWWTSKIALAFLLFHRPGLILIDEPPLALRRFGGVHLRDDLVDRNCL